jgi:hypothetical protein
MGNPSVHLRLAHGGTATCSRHLGLFFGAKPDYDQDKAILK